MSDPTLLSKLADPTLLSELANLAQIVGVLGVIGSLIFLTHQIRHNTLAVRASTYHALVTTYLDHMCLILQTPELVRVLNIGGVQGLSKLEEEDQIRFNFVMHHLFSIGNNVYYQHERRSVDDEALNRWHEHVRFYFETFPGVVEWWRNSPHFPYSPEFTNYLKNEFKSLLNDNYDNT